MCDILPIIFQLLVRTVTHHVSPYCLARYQSCENLLIASPCLYVIPFVHPNGAR